MHPLFHTKDTIGEFPIPRFATSGRTANPTLGCEEAMHALEECHARGLLIRLTGSCNDAKRAVDKCLRAARIERTLENHRKSKEKNLKLREAWADIDNNS